jgi:diguanylate cyclase (GGDEF)-like protein/PAS domain S-box-containing protein
LAEEHLDLFELLNLPVTVTDLHTGRIRRANAAACALLGRPESELVGLHWREVALLEESSRGHEESYLPGRDSSSRRLVRLLRPDHSVVHVVVSYARVRGPSGRPEILSQLQDISDEIAANDRLRLILDNTTVSMFLVDRGGIVLATKGLMDALMARISRHPGVSVFTLFADMPDAVGLLRTALTGKSVHDVVEVLGRCFDLHIVPIFGQDQEVSHLTCVATDVTERQRALATLRTRSAEQALIADLGQQALESLDSTTIWRHAAQVLATHLEADTVRIHELDNAGRRSRVLATATRTDDARARAMTDSNTAGSDAGEPDTREARTREVGTGETGICETGTCETGTCETGTDSSTGRPRSSPRIAVAGHSLVVATGRGDHPLAVVEVDRPPDSPPFTDQDAQFVRSVGAVLGAAAMRFRMEEDIRHRSLHDGLTGLPNRTALLDRLDRALRRARTDQARIGVLFIDLDGFKTVNDTLGHLAGDHLLRLTANRLEHAIRPGDLVGRLSGDEFAILCEHIDSAADIEAIADRVLTVLDLPCMLGEQMVLLSASVGIALSEPATADGEDLLNAADIAMYAAKRRGPGRRLAFDEAMRTQLMARITRYGELRRAMDAGELVMRYQPVRAIEDGLVGAEAMPHWRHPRRGLVSPADFLPEPEQPGLRVPLDRWTIGQACRAAARWEADRDGGTPPLLIMPVSGRSLAEPRFVPELDGLLAETGGQTRYRLCLEITMAEIVGDEATLFGVFGGLRRLGVAICIGEFGAAQPIMSAMTEFPFSFLRIGGVYVDGIEVDPVRHAGASGIVHFAHELGVHAVAGDVATAAQLKTLRAMRCDLAHGPAVGSRTEHLPRLTEPRPARRPDRPDRPSDG